jgi:hypothetical protein
MGMNLWMKKMPEEENVGWWNNDRFTGDGDFASADFEQEIEFPDETYSVFRPKNFDEARKWVEDNIPWEGNRERLIEGLNRMEKDKSLWFAYF